MHGYGCILGHSVIPHSRRKCSRGSFYQGKYIFFESNFKSYFESNFGSSLGSSPCFVQCRHSTQNLTQNWTQKMYISADKNNHENIN